jgi:prevent-host-death family protein
MSVLSRGLIRQLRYRNRRGDEVDVGSVTATEAKNEFGRVLEAAMEHGAVAITRHDAPKAVLVSVEEWNALVEATQSARVLDSLAGEFDALYQRMQAPAARKASKALFAASPAELGKAAVTMAARRRG